MNNISVSKLKANPAKAIYMATDYPVAIENRNETKAYLIGKNLYEKMIAYIEDYIDFEAVKSADFSKGKDLEKVAKELGL